MKKNLGKIDRNVRIIIAAIIVGAAYLEVITGVLEVVLLILAGIFLVTSVISFCPLYAAFKISSRKKKDKVVQ
ncbi:DUF2892 domain-containing protein [Lishizhenia sp.]|uniref:YgaP family membrane protein n=1 Tax=Lishizhenia sp. TaxID=2497594 RepID=UPI00299E1E33|nr:DUF2892 domain-containing protein [Lishizhenia sp.]MDX1445775.1 DUF2892 domain-containing protein [Lishizhenia sp.]